MTGEIRMQEFIRAIREYERDDAARSQCDLIAESMGQCKGKFAYSLVHSEFREYGFIVAPRNKGILPWESMEPVSSETLLKDVAAGSVVLVRTWRRTHFEGSKPRRDIVYPPSEVLPDWAQARSCPFCRSAIEPEFDWEIEEWFVGCHAAKCHVNPQTGPYPTREAALLHWGPVVDEEAVLYNKGMLDLNTRGE